MSEEEDVKFRFKILLLGDGAVGKTSLVHRFVHGKFENQYIMTIGMEPYSMYDTLLDTRILYSLWDIAGQDRFKAMRSMFYGGAMGSLLVFDLTRRASFDNLKNWVDEAISFSPGQEFIIVGNKNDLVDMREITSEEGRQRAEELGAIRYIETSAKTGENVEDAFRTLGTNLLKKRLS